MNQSEEHSISIQEQKSKIRERYRGVDPDTLECLPARPPENIYDEDRELRVAVYARVSTDDPRQTSSYELQKIIIRISSTAIPTGNWWRSMPMKELAAPP